MTAKRQDITIEQGADFDEEFDLPASINLTGVQAAMQIRTDFGFPSSLLTLTTQNGGLIINPTTRKLTPVISAATAAAFLAGRYVYDIKLRSTDGKTTRSHQGVASVSARVTLFDFDGEGPALLLESGGYLVLETGGLILLGA